MYSETRLPDGAALWRSVGGSGAVVPADGCVDLILRGGRLFVAGPSTRWIATLNDGDGGSMGLRLPPGHAHSLLGVGPAEIADQLVPADDVLAGSRAALLREAMLRRGDARDAPGGGDGGGDGLGEWLAPIANAARGENRWQDAVRRRAADAVSARQAAADVELSERTFRRMMLETFGYGYATLARIERANRAQALLRSGVALAEAGAAAGFADQPHLSREFRRLVGVSPGQFAAGSSA